MMSDSLKNEPDLFSSRQHFSIWMQAMCKPWRQVLDRGRKMELSSNQLLFGDGKPVKGLYFTQKGVLRFISIDQNGNEAILFYVTEDNLLGDAALFNKMPVYGHFQAVEDCTLYFFDENAVRDEIMPQHPDLTQNLLEYLAFKVGVLLHHHCEVLNTDVKGKVCRLLFDMCRYHGLQSSFTPKITQQEMATALGMHRTTLSKVFTDLKKEKIIAQATRSEIVLLDLEGLARYAEAPFAI
jgi:CRP-like cAMP-binding protein